MILFAARGSTMRWQATTLALTSALVVGIADTSAAQSAPNSGFGAGTRLVSVGLLAGGDYSGTGIGGQVEWGVRNVGRTTLSLGAFAGVQRKSTGAGSLEVTTSAVPVMAMGNIHFPMGSNDRVDVFAGASVGIVRISVKSEVGNVGSSSASDTNTGGGVQVGVRYRAASRLSLMGQLGLVDLPLIMAGVSLRL
jgi:hypothetical protein